MGDEIQQVVILKHLKFLYHRILTKSDSLDLLAL